MEITRTDNNESIVIAVQGKINSITCKDLEAELLKALEKSVNILLDLEKVDYVSSAGLRVLLLGEKKARALKITMTVRNICEDVYNVLEMTGFTNILTIQ
ncbi:MAG: STAS domain-containing protein [Clostridiales bacterium]|jgi:anti-anti-sigma factor|nr:STAS domain-containing protein [Clostridiales bacterium]